MKPPHCMLLALSLAVALAPLAGAQDVAQVSPETHKVILENAQVRVFDVHVRPGERVAMHSHPSGVLCFLSDATVRITYADGRTEERSVKAGTAAWLDATTHQIENIGTTELHEIHTEMKTVRADKS